jgi:hypothetical protein
MRPAFLPRQISAATSKQALHVAPAKPPIQQRIHNALDRASLRATTLVVQPAGLTDVECIHAHLAAEADFITAPTAARRFAASRDMARWAAELKQRGLDVQRHTREQLTALADSACPPCTGQCDSSRACPRTLASKAPASDDVVPAITEGWFAAGLYAVIATVAILVANGVIKL